MVTVLPLGGGVSGRNGPFRQRRQFEATHFRRGASRRDAFRPLRFFGCESLSDYEAMSKTTTTSTLSCWEPGSTGTDAAEFLSRPLVANVSPGGI